MHLLGAILSVTIETTSKSWKLQFNMGTFPLLAGEAPLLKPQCGHFCPQILINLCVTSLQVTGFHPCNGYMWLQCTPSLTIGTNSNNSTIV